MANPSLQPTCYGWLRRPSQAVELKRLGPMLRIRSLVLLGIAAASSGCAAGTPDVAQVNLKDKAAFEEWANSKIGRLYPHEACLRNGRNEACGPLVGSRMTAGQVEQLHRPVPGCDIAFVEARNSNRIARWHYASDAEHCWVPLPTEIQVLAPYVDPRALTEKDLAQAQGALEAFVPAEYHNYFMGEMGHGYKGDQFVHFSTRVPDANTAISRTKKITCHRLSRRELWRCDGPYVHVFVHGHSFPEPPDIDDQTIVAIVDFVDSRCRRDQARKLAEAGKSKGPPVGGRRLWMRHLRRTQNDTFVVTTGGRGRGSVLTIGRDNGAECRFRLHGVGNYVE